MYSTIYRSSHVSRFLSENDFTRRHWWSCCHNESFRILALFETVNQARLCTQHNYSTDHRWIPWVLKKQIQACCPSKSVCLETQIHKIKLSTRVAVRSNHFTVEVAGCSCNFYSDSFSHFLFVITPSEWNRRLNSYLRFNLWCNWWGASFV